MNLDIYPTRALTEQEKRRRLAGEMGIMGDFPITFENFVTKCIEMHGAPGTLIGDFKKGLILSEIYGGLLSEGKLTYFDSYQKGYVRQLGEVIGELKRQNMDPDEFRDLCLPGRAPEDIAKIYGTYKDYLKTRGLYDKEDRYRMCLRNLKKDSFAEYDILVFREFFTMSRIQKLIVEKLGERAEVTNSRIVSAIKKTEVTQAKDRKIEVYILAQSILRDLKAGLSPDNLCVVMRNQSIYRRDLWRIFQEAKIPLRFGQRHNLIQNPFTKALIYALEGNTGVYFDKTIEENNEISVRYAGMRSRQVLEYLSSSGYPERFYEIHGGDLKLIERDIKAYQALKNILTDLGAQETAQIDPYTEGTAESSENPRMYFGDFVSPKAGVSVETGIDAAHIETFSKILAGFAADHTYSHEQSNRGIAVLSPTNLRGLKFDKIYALGLTEGEFPRDFRPDWLLRDEERRYINKKGYNLDTIDLLLERERESFGFLTSACKEGYFSYPLVKDDGSPNLMSSYLEEQMEIGPKAVIKKVGFEESFRSSGAFDPEMLNLAPRKIGDIPVGELFNKAPFSASGINTYGQCPFKFFLERVLKLSKDIEEGYDKMARGGVLHSVLERFFRRHLGETLSEGDTEKYLCEMRSLVKEALGDDYKDSFKHPRLYDMEKDELIEILTNYIMYHIKIQGDFTAAHTEYGFGFKTGFSLDALPGVMFRGIIDRIDENSQGDLAIFDYKNNRTPSPEEISQGTNLQLPLYILAARQIFKKPVRGGAYISLGKAKADSILVWDRTLPFAKGKRKGILKEEQWQNLMDEVVNTLKTYVEAIRRGHFPLEPKKCPKLQEYGAFCDFTEVCPLEVEM